MMKSNNIINKRKTPMKYFAIHLRDKRLKRGWDQESIAHMSGLSVRTIQRIEAGNSCSLDTLKSLSAAMELNHFSELLPQPNKNEYHPSKMDLFKISLNELIIKNAIRVVTFTCFLIGLISFIYTIEMVDFVDQNLSVEERIEKEIQSHKKIKPDSPLFISKTEQQIRTEVIQRIENEKRPLNKEEWKELKGIMIWLFYFCLFLTTVYSLIRTFSTYEFNEVVNKPLELKFTNLIKAN
mgnify:FL=1